MKEKEIKIEPLKETKLNIQLIGDTDLILHGRSRYYLQSEIWKQSHPKGAEPPAIYKQNKNEWEALITSIHWLNPITYHDEDISLYSEEEWKDYMQNNKPCIQGIAFYKSFAESFVTFFKDSIKKNGTDVKRAINMDKSMYPINFPVLSQETLLFLLVGEIALLYLRLTMYSKVGVAKSECLVRT